MSLGDKLTNWGIIAAGGVMTGLGGLLLLNDGENVNKTLNNSAAYLLIGIGSLTTVGGFVFRYFRKIEEYEEKMQRTQMQQSKYKK